MNYTKNTIPDETNLDYYYDGLFSHDHNKREECREGMISMYLPLARACVRWYSNRHGIPDRYRDDLTGSAYLGVCSGVRSMMRSRRVESPNPKSYLRYYIQHEISACMQRELKHDLQTVPLTPKDTRGLGVEYDDHLSIEHEEIIKTSTKTKLEKEAIAAIRSGMTKTETATLLSIHRPKLYSTLDDVARRIKRLLGGDRLLD